MARKCLLVDRCIFPFDIRQARRYIWRLPCLCCWAHLAYDMEFNRWLLDERNHAQFLSCPSRAGPCCLLAIQCDDTWEHLSSRAKEESGVQYLRCLCANGILRRDFLCRCDGSIYNMGLVFLDRHYPRRCHCHYSIPYCTL